MLLMSSTSLYPTTADAMSRPSACVVSLFGQSVVVSGGGASVAGSPFEASELEVPNVELIVETATSCERSRLCMRLPNRHLAYQGAKARARPCLNFSRGRRRLAVVGSFDCRQPNRKDQAALPTGLQALYCLRDERAVTSRP